ncbi:RraA family protein [Maritalea sp.]|uniref:RraA family protein n=1 Tax=Maritalea sp. TaxID=2003361 RepID=UPI003EFB2ACA
MIEQSLLELLHSVDTPTVCNAIEVAQGKRGFSNFTRQTMQYAANGKQAMVGFAKTAKIAALAPPEEAPEIIKKRRMDYYRYMADVHVPSLAVIEDIDFPNCIGAYWGEINTTVHKGFGIEGALTNSVMRDLGDMAADFPVLAGSIGPSHGFVHVRDVDCDVSVCGMRVSPGDLIHADQHGALVIPTDVIGTLHAAINTLLKNEKIVLEPARQTDFDFEQFERYWELFEKART